MSPGAGHGRIAVVILHAVRHYLNVESNTVIIQRLVLADGLGNLAVDGYLVHEFRGGFAWSDNAAVIQSRPLFGGIIRRPVLR